MSVSGSLLGVRLSRVRVREVCAFETIHVHPSLLGHTIRTPLHIHSSKEKRDATSARVPSIAIHVPSHLSSDTQYILYATYTL
jgi:hypothetical protein